MIIIMISVIIPVYNREGTIDRTLENLLKQTYQDFEVIVINDGSRDKTVMVVENYSAKFQRQAIPFKLINRKDNRGAQKTRNEGYSYATGDYLLFCDADVILIPEALELFLKALNDSPQAGFSYSSHRFGGKLFKFFPFDDDRLKKMPYVHSTSLIRKESFPLEGWDESLKKFHDWDLFLTICEHGGRGVWIDKVLFEIISGGTMSSWLPSFAYKVFPFLPSVKKYKKAEKIIKEKHKI